MYAKDMYIYDGGKSIPLTEELGLNPYDRLEEERIEPPQGMGYGSTVYLVEGTDRRVRISVYSGWSQAEIC